MLRPLASARRRRSPLLLWCCRRERRLRGLGLLAGALHGLLQLIEGGVALRRCLGDALVGGRIAGSGEQVRAGRRGSFLLDDLAAFLG